MTAGKFITFEGGEGVGKSTQARLLAERLEARGTEVVLTREPGGSPFAEEVRNLLLSPATPPHSSLSEALLFYAARADHLDHVIRPALEAGRWVVSDRFADSTRVYQGAAGDIDGDLLAALEAGIVGSNKPDLTLILDMEAAAGLSRARERAGSAGEISDPFEQRVLAFHERLRAGYLALAASEPQRCVVLQASCTADVVAAEVWSLVQQRLMKVRD